MYVHEQLMKTRHQENLRTAAREREAADAVRQARAKRPRRSWLMPVRRLASLRPTISTRQRA
jgi:hypothetical protein